MFNFRHGKDETLAELSTPECQLLMDFMRISARQNTSARAAERHLMSSLTFAFRAKNKAC